MFGSDGKLRLVDFGLAKQSYKRMKTMAGTPYFMAPEVLEGNYGSKCDIWSLGCILFMIMTGRLPFEGNSRRVVFAKIKAGEFSVENANLSSSCKDMIKKMLCVKQDKRWSAAQLLEHPWIVD